jgi:hypothetical protein
MSSGSQVPVCGRPITTGPSPRVTSTGVTVELREGAPEAASSAPSRTRLAAASSSGASRRSSPSGGTAARRRASVARRAGLVVSGARNSMPWAAQSASMPRMRSRFATIGARRRAPWAAMETWSSWLAEVGVESVEQGWARCLFSLISAAVVTSAIM